MLKGSALRRSEGCYASGKARIYINLEMMDTADLLARIAAEPGKMGGKPVTRGRRITPSMVLTMLAKSASREAVLKAYPVLEPADIVACLLYAARLSELAAAEGLMIPAE